MLRPGSPPRVDSRPRVDSPPGVDNYSDSPPGVDDYLDSPPGVNDYLDSPPGVDDYSDSPPGVDDYLDSPPGVDDGESHPPKLYLAREGAQSAFNEAHLDVSRFSVGLSGRFGAARFNGSFFATLSPTRVVPSWTLREGLNRWRLQSLSTAHLNGLLGRPGGDEESAFTSADVGLRWRRRAAATFALRVSSVVPLRYENTEQPFAELTRDLYRALNYGRAAGIEARVDLHLTMPVESLAIEEMLERFAVHNEVSTRLELDEEAPVPRVAAVLDEQVEVEDEERIVVTGVFDMTRFNGSILNERPPLEGAFDEAHFDAAVFPHVPAGVFGASPFGRARFN